MSIVRDYPKYCVFCGIKIYLCKQYLKCTYTFWAIKKHAWTELLRAISIGKELYAVLALTDIHKHTLRQHVIMNLGFAWCLTNKLSAISSEKELIRCSRWLTHSRSTCTESPSIRQHAIVKIDLFRVILLEWSNMQFYVKMPLVCSIHINT